MFKNFIFSVKYLMNQDISKNSSACLALHIRLPRRGKVWGSVMGAGTNPKWWILWAMHRSYWFTLLRPCRRLGPCSELLLLCWHHIPWGSSLKFYVSRQLPRSLTWIGACTDVGSPGYCQPLVTTRGVMTHRLGNIRIQRTVWKCIVLTLARLLFSNFIRMNKYCKV